MLGDEDMNSLCDLIEASLMSVLMVSAGIKGDSVEFVAQSMIAFT